MGACRAECQNIESNQIDFPLVLHLRQAELFAWSFRSCGAENQQSFEGAHTMVS